MSVNKETPGTMRGALKTDRRIREKRTASRNQRGIIVGILNTAVVTPIVLGVAFLLLNASVTEYYQQKADFILEQAGHYAIHLPDASAGPQPYDVVAGLLKQSGITVWNLKVETSKAISSKGEVLELKLSGQFPLIAGTILPSIQTIKATKSIPLAVNQRYAQVAISAFPHSNEHHERGPSVYVPLVRVDGDKPVWSFQQDESIAELHIVAGQPPMLCSLGESNRPGMKSIY